MSSAESVEPSVASAPDSSATAANNQQVPTTPQITLDAAFLTNMMEHWKKATEVQAAHYKYLFQQHQKHYKPPELQTPNLQVTTSTVTPTLSTTVQQPTTQTAPSAGLGQGEKKKRLPKEITAELTKYLNELGDQPAPKEGVLQLAQRLQIPEQQVQSYLYNKRARLKTAAKKAATISTASTTTTNATSSTPTAPIVTPPAVSTTTSPTSAKPPAPTSTSTPAPAVKTEISPSTKRAAVGTPSTQSEAISPSTKRATTFEEELASILDEKRMLKSSDATPLLKMMKKVDLSSSKALECKQLLLEVIDKQEKPILKSLVDEGCLSILKKWLTSTGTKKFFCSLLDTLDLLPVTITSLQESSIGKTINKLKINKDPEIQQRAASLFDRWKKLLETSILPGRSTATNEDDKRVAKSEKLELKKAATTPKPPTTSKKSSTKENPPDSKSSVTITTNDDFEAMMGSSTTAPRAVKRPIAPPIDTRKTKVQLLQSPTETRVTTSKATYDSKPLSADDIKKAKQKERWNNEENNIKPKTRETPASSASTSTPTTLSPPTAKSSENESTTPMEITSSTSSATEEPKKAKKRVRWQSDDKLISIKRFKRERPPGAPLVDRKVSSIKMQLQGGRVKEDFDRQAIIQQKEREEMEIRERLRQMTPTVMWRIPTKLEIPEDMQVARGEESREVKIQEERTRQILNVVYYRPEDIPKTPIEAEDSPADLSASCTIIPYDEFEKAPAAPPPPPPQQTQYDPFNMFNPQPNAFGVPPIPPQVAPLPFQGLGQPQQPPHIAPQPFQPPYLPPEGNTQQIPPPQNQAPTVPEINPSLLNNLLSNPSLIALLQRAATVPQSQPPPPPPQSQLPPQVQLPPQGFNQPPIQFRQNEPLPHHLVNNNIPPKGPTGQNDFYPPKHQEYRYNEPPRQDYNRNQPPPDYNRSQPPPDYNRHPQDYNRSQPPIDYNRGNQDYQGPAQHQDYRSHQDYRNQPPSDYHRNQPPDNYRNQGYRSPPRDHRSPPQDYRDHRGPQQDYRHPPQHSRPFKGGPNKPFRGGGNRWRGK